MNIPKVWRRAARAVRGRDGRELELAAWGWSASDPAEAEAKARERLARLVAHVESGGELRRDYGYGERALREEILDELYAPKGELAAVLTRNSYGSVVLNAARAVFVDVDLPPEAPPRTAGAAGSVVDTVLGWLGLGGTDRAAETPTRTDPEAEVIARMRRTLEAEGGGWRIYRTAAGFRVLRTDAPGTPGDGEVESLMRRLGADPDFVKLCRAQRSFRARLTPKPWRCGADRPPVAFPREDDGAEARFREWLAAYERACEPNATCRLVARIGTDRVHEDLRPVVEAHDRLARVESALPLA